LSRRFAGEQFGCYFDRWEKSFVDLLIDEIDRKKGFFAAFETKR